MIKLQQPIENFTFITTDKKQQDFSDFYNKKNIVLYFYPKDDTPGCTLEGKDFSMHHTEFLNYDTIIFGVSRDNLVSHHKFKEKYCFPFPLISDENEELCGYFEVLKLKNLYGKKVRGIERSTFLIDKKGLLQRQWRGVKVDGHVLEVLKAVKSLSTTPGA